MHISAVKQAGTIGECVFVCVWDRRERKRRKWCIVGLLKSSRVLLTAESADHSDPRFPLLAPVVAG